MSPVVRVIGYTTFLGVPEELTDKGVTSGQDEGSDLARLIECAGRTCYDSYGKGRASATYHSHILEVGHGSVMEHAVINFYIAGISRGSSHELVRHRVGTAISQRSTRYVDESESDWSWHPLIEKAAAWQLETAANDTGYQGLSIENELPQLEKEARYTYLCILKTVQDYLTHQGVDKLTARKQARGAARGALGNSLETAMVWSANIRTLRNVIEQRCSSFADAEIRLLANALLEKARLVCPEYFSDYETHPCEDGIGFYVSTNHRKV